jgi:monoamine oxidase
MKKEKDTTLYAQLLAAKEEETNATARRVELEEEIYALHRSELQKSEGQETLENFGYKITINQPMTYKLDDAKYRKLAETLPEEMQFHRTKLELDKTKYSSLLVMAASPEVKKYIKKIQDCVSVKPGKVSVKVEKIEAEK